MCTAISFTVLVLVLAATLLPMVQSGMYDPHRRAQQVEDCLRNQDAECVMRYVDSEELEAWGISRETAAECLNRYLFPAIEAQATETGIQQKSGEYFHLNVSFRTRSGSTIACVQPSLRRETTDLKLSLLFFRLFQEAMRTNQVPRYAMLGPPENFFLEMEHDFLISHENEQNNLGLTSLYLQQKETSDPEVLHR